jgi:hypothetical protein
MTGDIDHVSLLRPGNHGARQCHDTVGGLDADVGALGLAVGSKLGFQIRGDRRVLDRRRRLVRGVLGLRAEFRSGRGRLNLIVDAADARDV